MKELMEKLVVTIGLVGPLSTNFERHKENYGSYPAKDIKFLCSCFEISQKRAQKIMNKLLEQKTCRSRYIELTLSYRQLARYTAKRQVEGLNQRWKYPSVSVHEEPTICEQSVSWELRPDKRSKQC